MKKYKGLLHSGDLQTNEEIAANFTRLSPKDRSRLLNHISKAMKEDLIHYLNVLASDDSKPALSLRAANILISMGEISWGVAERFASMVPLDRMFFLCGLSIEQKQKLTAALLQDYWVHLFTPLPTFDTPMPKLKAALGISLMNNAAPDSNGRNDIVQDHWTIGYFPLEGGPFKVIKRDGLYHDTTFHINIK